MKSVLYYDISEFLANPLCTGIQRVVFEIARSWPDSVQLKFCFVNPQHQLISLPDNFFRLMNSYFLDGTANKSSVINQFQSFLNSKKPIISFDHFLNSYGILVPEVFFDTTRIFFYQNLLNRCVNKLFFVCFDMLPWLHPEWFSMGAVLGTMNYLKLLTQVSHRCFISTQSALDFRDRILRQPSQKLDHVIPLGADAFGFFPSSFNPDSREFVVLGSIEPRKNHSAIIDSFLSLWNSNVDCRLTFLGRVGWIDPDYLSRLNTLSQSEPRFQWFQTPSDQFVITRIRSCRATIYPSLGEGYGLPPVESLALGVPVIVSANLPSVQMLPPLGQIRLDNPTSQTIQSAVLQMLNDGFAQSKYQEVDELQSHLPRWANLGPYLAEWIISLNNTKLG